MSAKCQSPLSEIKRIKIPYEKPIIVEEKSMKFPFDMINGYNTKYVCRQCSSCHGCR